MGGGGSSSLPPNILNSGGGGGDSMLGRVMGNVSQQIPEGMDTNTFLVHKQMFPEQSPQEVAEQRGMSLEEYIQQLMGLG